MKTITHAERVITAMEQSAQRLRDDGKKPEAVSDLALTGDMFTQFSDGRVMSSSATRRALQFLVDSGRLEKIKGWTRQQGNRFFLLTPERIALKEQKSEDNRQSIEAEEFLAEIGFPIVEDR